ncbi:MAG TPA: hypothetical protein PL182_13155 [Pseudobdellovibrionaceae bacterium]|nr:hypothetical protein [Pseudobdellovibrionaceae bacterium]
MSAVRMNITLPAEVVKKLKRSVKPRERSAVIAEALKMYFRRQSEADFVKQLIEDYKSLEGMSSEDRDWLNADLEANSDED